ncbi:N-acetyl-gamma-glutamyl-phosphate reductase [Candidatus Poribacteria bacterium]|nr:N-acetyl-gamma-glutamyl-phosphate reductase [Candidatus Poribacteria bacterium]
MRIAIVGASGYTSSELIRLLVSHPGGIDLVAVTSETYPGVQVTRAMPNLRGYCDLSFESFDLDALRDRIDVAVLAVPHKVAQDFAPVLLGAGLRVIDFSADYRLHSADDYESWYKSQHTTPDLLSQAVYGLPERYRDAIRSADLVANPGCYPTSAILGAMPLVENGFVEPDSIIIDSKSGISGAGKKADEKTHFANRESNLTAYNIGVHRHTPEIEQELTAAAGETVRVSFTPHLMPMTRGILSTIYATLRRPMSTGELLDAYFTRFKAEPFVQVLDAGEYAQTKAVLGSNNVHISLEVDPRVGRVVVTSVLDNLVKGASGAVVQNLNLMAGLDETAGIRFPGLMP